MTTTPSDLEALSDDELQVLIDELREQRQRNKSEFASLVNRDLTDGQRQRMSDIGKATQRAEAALEAATAERRTRLAAGAASGKYTTERGDGAGTDAQRAEFFAPNVSRSRYADPWDYTRSGSLPTGDLRGRALAAIERSAGGDDSNRQLATEVVEQSTLASDPSGLTHRWAVASASPHYLSAFGKFMRDPAAAHYSFDGAERAAFAEVREVSRAMGEGSIAAGGAMVPQSLDPAIILTNSGNENPFRTVSTVKRIATQTWSGVSSAGVTAEWTAEAAEVADATPTLAQPEVTPIRGDAYIEASWEFTDDTRFSSEITGLLMDARANLEATAFAVGSGSTQPVGIVTALGLVTASRVAGSSGAAGAADFVIGDVYALSDALPARAQGNASWMAARAIYNKVRRFGENVTGDAALWTDLGPGKPSQLLGHNAYVASGMDSTIVSGSNDDILVLGDFREFVIVDNVGSHLVYNPLVLGSNRRPTGQSAWVYFWRTGSDCVNPSQFRMLRL